MHYYTSVLLKEELFNVKLKVTFTSSMRSPTNVVNVFIRNLEFRLVARQLLFSHMAKLSSMRAISFSGLGSTVYLFCG